MSNRHERRANASLARKKLPLVNRHCGECTACCTVLGVKELTKAPYQPCEHELPKKGCGVYRDRPQSCKAFECIWKQGMVPVDQRPDKTGIIWSVTVPKPGRAQLPVAMEVWDGATDQEPGRSHIARVLRTSAVIIVDSTDKRRLVGYAGDPIDYLTSTENT